MQTAQQGADIMGGPELGTRSESGTTASEADSRGAGLAALMGRNTSFGQLSSNHSGEASGLGLPGAPAFAVANCRLYELTGAEHLLYCVEADVNGYGPGVSVPAELNKDRCSLLTQPRAIHG